MAVLHIFGTTFVLYLAVILIDPSIGDDPSIVPYDQLYEAGKTHYTREQWLDTILHMERAIKNYKLRNSEMVGCRMKCTNHSKIVKDVHALDHRYSHHTELNFFAQVVKKAECLKHCLDDRLGDIWQLPVHEDIEKEFEERVPYDYLQLAYWRTNQLAKAVSAAHTFIVANPDHPVMRDNMEFYKDFEGVTKDMFQDMERPEHEQMFYNGVAAYNDEDYKECKRTMEKAIKLYLQADQECRVQCEGPYIHEYFPEFFQSITNHYSSVLKCKTHCPEKVAGPNQKTQYKNYLPMHYHYLQFCLFQLGEVVDAAQAAASFLLFIPDHGDMLQNIQFYQRQADTTTENLQPRKEAVEYLEMVTLEQKLLDLAETTFDPEDEMSLGDDEAKDEEKQPITEDMPNPTPDAAKLIRKGDLGNLPYDRAALPGTIPDAVPGTIPTTDTVIQGDKDPALQGTDMGSQAESAEPTDAEPAFEEDSIRRPATEEESPEVSIILDKTEL
ncbi:cartilage-associated protein-like isoform X2 [Branchiostoma lanceolatum]|uniref:cartilage-associated protein-like isoform X2 n=1 Tax=Branchiostoma lanceolatum TaxID=7740 RepID=UPI0034540316